MPGPDFVLIGAPKAGTTALHSALDSHPQLLMSRVKEPKFYLCDGRRPAPPTGPGDAHSVREWIWRQERYEALFDGPAGLLRGESTPFYLSDPAAHRRMAASVPEAKLIAVVRDPVDRAHSNWLHLWSDGLETVGDFVEACRREESRIRAGWSPFWHYLRLGRYGEQFADLFRYFPPEQVHILRYRDLVDTPGEALDGICRFLGVAPGAVGAIPTENARGFVRPSARSRALSATIRTGARLGAAFPPNVWRRASAPLIWLLQRGAGPRPTVGPEDRRELVETFRADIALLGEITGSDFSDWLGDECLGEFRSRVERRTSAGECVVRPRGRAG